MTADVGASSITASSGPTGVSSRTFSANPFPDHGDSHRIVSAKCDIPPRLGGAIAAEAAVSDGGSGRIPISPNATNAPTANAPIPVAGSGWESAPIRSDTPGALVGRRRNSEARLGPPPHYDSLEGSPAPPSRNHLPRYQNDRGGNRRRALSLMVAVTHSGIFTI